MYPNLTRLHISKNSVSSILSISKQIEWKASSINKQSRERISHTDKISLHLTYYNIIMVNICSLLEVLNSEQRYSIMSEVLELLCEHCETCRNYNLRPIYMFINGFNIKMQIPLCFTPCFRFTSILANENHLLLFIRAIDY